MPYVPTLLADLAAGRNVLYRSQLVPRIPRQTIKCQACSRWGNAWDHCHAHGWIRGLLCGRCNMIFAELDRNERPSFVGDGDVDRWARWAQRCNGCAGRVSLSTDFERMSVWVNDALARA